MDVLGVYEIPLTVTLNGHTKTCSNAPVYVCQSLTSPGILGINMINEFNISFAPPPTGLVFHDKPQKVTAIQNAITPERVYTTRSTFIKAHEAVTVRLSCKAHNASEHRVGVYTFSPEAVAAEHIRADDNCLVNIEQEGYFLATLHNFGPTDVTVPSRTYICLLYTSDAADE